jgi:DNA-binding CsgD family transcriptional regulator
MLGLEISIAPFIIILIEVIYLISQIIYSIAVRFKSKGTLRFILLNLSFLFYNVFFIAGITNSIDSAINHFFLVASGAFLVSLSITFVVDTFNTVQTTKKRMLLQFALFCVALPFSHMSVYYHSFLSQSKTFDPEHNIPNSSILAISIIVLLLMVLIRLKSDKAIRLKSGIIVFILFNAFTFPLYLSSEYSIQLLILNQFFLVAGVYQIIGQILVPKSNRQNYKMIEFLLKVHGLQKPLEMLEYQLTKRQFEVAKLILQDKSFKEICNELHIAENTATRHASDIYSRTNCTDKREFILKHKIRIKDY